MAYFCRNFLSYAYLIIISLFKFSISQSSFLYSYGSGAGDSASPAADDDCSISYTHTIRMFGVDYSDIRVCTNGILTLDNDYTAFTPNSFPLSTGVPIIAPFWGDSDLRLGGNLWSRELTADLDILGNASDYISDAYKVSFDAEWAVLVTWFEILGYGSLDYAALNTFQAIILTSSSDTYAIFLYDVIGWTHGSTNVVHAQVGFDAGDGTNSYAAPTSQTEDVADIGSGSNINSVGLYVFKLSDPTISVPDQSGTTAAPQATTTKPHITHTLITSTLKQQASTSNQLTTTEFKTVTAKRSYGSQTTTSSVPSTTSSVPTTQLMNHDYSTTTIAAVTYTRQTLSPLSTSDTLPTTRPPTGRTAAQESGTTTSRPVSSKVIAAAVVCAVLSLATLSIIISLLFYRKRKDNEVFDDEIFSPSNAPIHHIYPGEIPDFWCEAIVDPCNLITEPVDANVVYSIPAVSAPTVLITKQKDGVLPPLRNPPKVNAPLMDMRVVDYEIENISDNNTLSVPSV